ncbi:MAG: transcriptional regulator GcvA [Rhodospirillales bacterium]|nr:transcriptional regulator GcvA [Rhodospirillales bacterium]
MRRLPPLSALRAFEAAARHLSFTKAAEELHVTQAAISHQVKALEEHLGRPLFRRLTRALRLTPAGEAYRPVLTEAFEAIERATRRLQAESERQGVLNISLTPAFMSRWLIPRLGYWQEAHPEIELRLTSTPKLADFSRDGIDLAVRHGRGAWPGLIAHRLFQSENVPVCSPALVNGPLPLAKPADLAHHTLLHDFVEPELWRIWLAAVGVEGVDPDRGLRLSDSADTIQAAIAGSGVAMTRRALIGLDLAAGRLVIPFDIRLPSEYAFYIVYPEASAERPMIRMFRDWVLEQVAAETPGG